MSTSSGGRDALGIKVELQSLGAIVPGGVRARAGGAGPADGVTITIGELTATVPTGAWYAARSPYRLMQEENGTWRLLKDGASLADIDVLKNPGFYGLETPGSVPFHKIALRHGRDGIGSTVAQGCSHGEDSCMFCAISVSKQTGATIPRKSPAEIAEVAVAAEDEGFAHVVLTTGSTGQDAGIGHLVSCAAEVKRRTAMRVHVQFEPPTDEALIGMVAEVSDSAAINIECFDGQVLERVAPGKAKIGLERFIASWTRAVETFGEGQVTSFIILGLGETSASVCDGAKLLASIGVYPFLLPLRPLRGTPLESWSPPPPSEVMRAYDEAAEVVVTSGLSASQCLAGCVRCGACTAFTDMTG